MNELDFFQKYAFFTTREYALKLGVSIESASRRLNRYLRQSKMKQITRGIWANHHHPYFSIYSAIPLLLDGEYGYLSFLSALHRHEIISQIPTTIQIATTGRSRKLKSTLGEFHFFQLNPKMMTDGIDLFEGNTQYNIASPEKALLDTIYISTKKGHRFKRLPELDLGKIKIKRFKALLTLYPQIAQKLIWDRYLEMKTHARANTR
jgi:predicted transcriptional regulator of viral defense system